MKYEVYLLCTDKSDLNVILQSFHTLISTDPALRLDFQFIENGKEVLYHWSIDDGRLFALVSVNNQGRATILKVWGKHTHKRDMPIENWGKSTDRKEEDIVTIKN